MKLLLLLKLCSISSFYFGGPFLSLQFYFTCLLIFCQIWNLYTLIPRPFLNSTQVALNLKCRSSQCVFVHMCMYNGCSRQVCIVYEEWRNEWLGFVISVSYVVRKVQCVTRGVLIICVVFDQRAVERWVRGATAVAIRQGTTGRPLFPSICGTLCKGLVSSLIPTIRHIEKKEELYCLSFWVCLLSASPTL
jgi:hypothetical protein